jgi:hypothetical protein
MATRLRPIGIAIALLLLLAGCVASPEAARVSGGPGADVGNRGSAVELLAPPDRFKRIYYDIPYIGPRVAQENTAQS